MADRDRSSGPDRGKSRGAGGSGGGSRSRPSGKPGGRSSGKPGSKDRGKPTGRSSGAGKPSGRPGGRSGGTPRSAAGARGGTPARRPGSERPPSPFDEDLLAELSNEQVLPREVAVELEAFPARVKDLLAASYVLVEDDPADALRYALEAKRMAGRSSIVREAVGVVAYQNGDYELAVKELRAARRISGLDTLVPLIADCERALGQPEKALALADEELQLDRANRVELRIVAAGARMDLGQPEAAQLLLRGRLLDSEDRTAASARLKYAYAEALLAAGDAAGARGWFLRAADADAEGDTDADERAALIGAEGDR